MTIIKEFIKVADIHADRISMALKAIKNKLPFKKEDFQSFDTETILLTELLISRFGKLQDILGVKIINQFLLDNQENTNSMTMLDKINRAEALGIIKNAEIWKEIRTARNHAAHEYPESPELTAIYLNQVASLAPELLEILNEIKRRSGF